MNTLKLTDFAYSFPMPSVAPVTTGKREKRKLRAAQ